jgi:DNA sulfur modification protein DndD
MLWRQLSISKLEMHNFRRFRGHHELALTTNPPEKTLVLIGGDNGRGKTSIHEAINYALYMDDDLPGIATKPNYLKAVSERLNRRALDRGETDYWVALELTSSEVGAPRVLRIKRTWKVNLRERCVIDILLEISENGRPIDSVEQNPDAYQDFLRNLLPPRIAPFFFFDGERIQEFAEDDTHDRRMHEAILDILHITVYRRLQEDLKKYVIDHLEKYEVRGEESDNYYDLLKDVERIETEIEKKKVRLRENEWEQEQGERERKNVDSELRRVTVGPAPTKRDEVVASRERLQSDIENVKDEIETVSESLPLLLAGSLLAELDKGLVNESRASASLEAPDGIKSKLENVEEETFGQTAALPEQLRLDFEQEALYRERYRTACKKTFGLEEKPPVAILHDIGDRERRRIMERIAATEGTAGALKDLLDRRERLESELRGAEEQLRANGGNPEVNSLIDRSAELSERLGQLQTEHKNLTGESQRLEADLATRRRQVEERQRARAARSEAEKAVKLAYDAQTALQSFVKRLAPSKLALLKHHFEEMYSRLRKPEDPARRVEIDQDTWRVTLLDDQDRPLEKRVFSAGMKEMYALSLLWALSKASAWELPIVIDTPAGRLDTTNRRALFEKYLPHAGHQVIVLSTDTEVDIEWARRLEPHVARQYCLDYDEKQDSTVIRPGYFF